jgi:hypothetical protein
VDDALHGWRCTAQEGERRQRYVLPLLLYCNNITLDR